MITATADERCGTDAGYQAHRYRREAPCQPCKTAHAASLHPYRPARCGTHAAYQAHRKRGERPCPPCAEAASKAHVGFALQRGQKHHAAESEPFDAATVLGAARAIRRHVADVGERFEIAAMLGLR